MALSAEQKQINKKRNAIRDRLHRERKRERDERREAVMVEMGGGYNPALDAAGRRHDTLRIEKETRVKAIRDQIAALQEQIKQTEEAYEPLLSAAAQERREAGERRSAARRAAEEDVEAEFPDLSIRDGSLFSARTWAATKRGKAIVEAAWREAGLLDESEPAPRRRGPKV